MIHLSAIERIREAIREMEADIHRGPRPRCVDRQMSDYESADIYKNRADSFMRTKLAFLSYARAILRQEGIPEQADEVQQ